MSLKDCWEEFARSLNSNGKCLLQEGTIDKINENYNEKEEKARQVCFYLTFVLVYCIVSIY